MERKLWASMMNENRFRLLAVALVGLAAGGDHNDGVLAQSAESTADRIADFGQPWAMAFLPDGRRGGNGGLLRLTPN